MKVNYAGGLRLFIVIAFWYLAIQKILLFAQSGMTPFIAVVHLADWPEILKYYGVVALGIELIVIFGVWSEHTTGISLTLGILLCFLGILFSLYSMWFKSTSACGCGLLGQNEFGYLAQKVFLLTTLVLLAKNQHAFTSMQT